jgi:uncharacterized membrane protein YebE (DUF533 family)
MSSIVETGGSLLTKALALKAGKFIWKRGGIAGLGVVAVAGAIGYVAYKLLNKGVNKVQDETSDYDEIENNYPHVEGEKTIVV